MSQSKSLTEQLSDVFGRHLDSHLSTVEQEFHRLKEGLFSSLDSLHARLQHEARERLRGTLTQAAASLAGDASAALASRHEGRLTSLAGACRRILASRSQAEILASLADGAAPFCSRAVLFISKGEYLVPWEVRGFGSQESETAIRSTQIPKRSDTTLAQACQEQRPAHGDIGSHRENAQLAERLGGGRPEKLLCLPVIVHEKSTAVLYTDALEGQGETLNLEALSLLVEMAQVRIELHALEARLGIKPARPAPPAAVLRPAASPTPAAAPVATAPTISERLPERKLEPVIEPVTLGSVPEAAALEPEATTMLTSPAIAPVRPAPEYEEAPRLASIAYDSEATTQLSMQDIPMFGASMSEPDAPSAGPATVEPSPATAAGASDEEAVEIDLDALFSPAAAATGPVPAMPAAERTPAPITADLPAAEGPRGIGFIAQPPPIPDAPMPPPLPRLETGAPEPSPASAAPTASELERLHNEAKRFARLLASEIKLYNEQAVNEGRRQRDIYDRLKKEIDRSRNLYEKRVSPLVARRVDYFHDELVRILGANDPTALGSDYPGPRLDLEESGR